jgi:eukaryotic-like serine/threonine-protein kinase
MLGPGFRVEDYEVLAVVAVGAMCQVYEARAAAGAKQSVAVKVLHESWRDEQDIVTRFLNEASILRGFEHPHIVRLLASGSLSTGAPYMVLEWLPSTLECALAEAESVPDPRTAARLAREIATALATLHARGIVHRDLKPANVLLDACGLAVAQAKLADLGLAKVCPEPQGEQIAVGHVSTGGGTQLGTWDYMAPEQWIKSKTVDARADVYSLGVLLFQMLSGRLPFIAEEPMDLMMLHLLDRPPMDRLGERVPAAFRELVGEMLAKKASGRPSIEEVIQRLGEVG